MTRSLEGRPRRPGDRHPGQANDTVNAAGDRFTLLKIKERKQPNTQNTLNNP